MGDPHILRWNQKSFEVRQDLCESSFYSLVFYISKTSHSGHSSYLFYHFQFHGECDLLLVHSDSVNDKPFDLHIRTTMDGIFSSITSLAFRIGDEVVEIDPHKVNYRGKAMNWNKMPFVGENFEIGKPLRNNRRDRIFRTLNITLTDETTIHVTRTMDYSSFAFLSVSLTGGHDDFDNSYGLLGQHGTGVALSRNGSNMEGQWNEYGLEWQVRENEPKLFREKDRAPQLPMATCNMPTESIPELDYMRQKHPELYDKARIACARKGTEMEDCIEDVMLAGDTKVAQAY